MTAEYEITLDDVSIFNVYHHRHSPIARRQYLQSWLIPAIVWLLVCTGFWYLADQRRGTPLATFLDLLPLFGGVPLWLLYFPWAYRRKLRKNIAGMISEGQNRGLLGRQRVTISTDGITESSEFAQTSIAWHAIEKVAATDDYAYIYTSALAAIIVPRRTFAGPQEFEKFVRVASGYHANAVA